MPGCETICSTLHVSIRFLNLPEKKSVQIPEFVKEDHQKLCVLEEMMLYLRKDIQNHQPLR